MATWTDLQIESYYRALSLSDYPRVFWQRLKPHIKHCNTMLDIGCGPGAFTITAAKAGYEVTGIDLNQIHLEALRRRAKGLGCQQIKTILGDWSKLSVKPADFTLCAYSLGGSIGTEKGIKKVLEATRMVAFFIVPYQRVQTEFLSRDIYNKVGIEPPSFSSNFHKVLSLFKDLKQQVQYEVVEYDFGVPLVDCSEAEMNNCAAFLSQKLEIKELELIKKHIKQILVRRNGSHWVPNPKTGVLITWKGV